MDILLRNEAIGSKMFSIYINLEKNGRSSIKFGGYDLKAIHPDSHPIFFKTMNMTTWSMRAEHFKFSDEEIKFKRSPEPTGRVVLFNPAFPWIHIPHRDFDYFASLFNARFRRIGLTCNRFYGECKFKDTCDNIRKRYRQKFDFSFQVFDERQS